LEIGTLPSSLVVGGDKWTGEQYSFVNKFLDRSGGVDTSGSDLESEDNLLSTNNVLVRLG